MKIMIIGSSGLLGSKLLDRFSRKKEALGTFFSSSRKSATYKNVIHLDVRQHEVVQKTLLHYNPDTVIYNASISRPDYCEENQDHARAVNFEALKNVASLCSSLGKKIIYFSTDQVFDGEKSSYNEQDQPNPLNYFAQTKLMSEEFLRQSIPNHIIVRPTTLYSFSPYTEGRGIFNDLIDKLDRNKSIELDDYRMIYPLLADDVSDFVEILIKKDEVGTFHISGKTPTTKYGFGKMISEIYGLNQDLLKPVKETEKDLKAKRPFQVNLNCKGLEQMGLKITEIEQGVSIHKQQKGCLFRMIYSVRPDMLVSGQNASSFRIQAGKAVVEENPVPDQVDCVIPIPESGIYSATGVSAQSKRPLYFGLIRDYFTEKTLYSANQEDRHQALKRKLVPVDSVVQGQNIVLVDEAVLSGSTLKVVIESLKQRGVGEIHVRIPSPIMANDCTGKILPNVKLIARNFPDFHEISKKDYEEKLAKELGVHSIAFLSKEKFLSIVEHNQRFCAQCFV